MVLPDAYYDSDFVAEFYDHEPPYRDRADVDFYVDAAVRAGGPVLEIGCGTGRVLIPTARAGIEIVGLDSSSHMLRVCGERLADETEEVRSRVRLEHGEMRDFDLGRTFELITIPFRPFQHLISVDDQRSCLGHVLRHLGDGGRLVMDVFNPSLELLVSDNVGEELGDDPEFTTPDGRRVVRRYRTVERDLFNQIVYVEMIYYVTHPDGREERLVQGFPMRYLFRFELEHLLDRCGFTLASIHSDFAGSSYGAQYPGDLVVVAEKK